MNLSLTIESLAALVSAEDFTAVYDAADKVRKAHKGDFVDIRALLEFSNVCRCDCNYCGLRASNQNCHRFRMTPEEMIETAYAAADAGYKTIVMQSGEDPYYTKEMLGDIVREIKKTGMAVTLSCGERDEADYAYWRSCGADRYLMKHETADADLYAALHPGHTLKTRVDKLKYIKSVGYETGSGFMIGIPGQTAETIAKDLLLLKEIGCDMAGIGPYIPHPDTPMKDCEKGSTELTMRAVALARLILPDANLPATTALGVIDASDKRSVFDRGANVVMRKVTPDAYKQFYEIYPAKFGKTDVKADRRQLEDEIRALGRIPR